MRGKSILLSVAVFLTLMLFLTLPSPVATLISISLWSGVLLFQNSILCVTRGLVNSIGVAVTLNTQAVTADITTPSAAVDLINFDSAVLVVQSGAVVSSGIARAVVYDSDDGISWGAVAADDLDGAFTNMSTANAIQKVGYKGTKRYVGLGAAYVSGTSIVLTGLVVEGHPHVAKVP
jgi:hypothetical protein